MARYMNPENSIGRSGLFRNYTLPVAENGVRMMDRNTVEFNLSFPSGAFINFLSLDYAQSPAQARAGAAGGGRPEAGRNGDGPRRHVGAVPAGGIWPRQFLPGGKERKLLQGWAPLLRRNRTLHHPRHRHPDYPVQGRPAGDDELRFLEPQPHRISGAGPRHGGQRRRPCGGPRTARHPQLGPDDQPQDRAVRRPARPQGHLSGGGLSAGEQPGGRRHGRPRLPDDGDGPCAGRLRNLAGAAAQGFARRRGRPGLRPAVDGRGGLPRRLRDQVRCAAGGQLSRHLHGHQAATGREPEHSRAKSPPTKAPPAMPSIRPPGPKARRATGSFPARARV